jgi:hypothetical protein
VYPLSVIVTKGVFDLVSETDPSIGEEPEIPYFRAPPSWDVLSWDVPGDCNPFDLDFGYTKTAINKVFRPESVDRLLYQFFIGGLLNTVLNLLIALTSIRALSRIFGTEVDVSALARVA